MDIDFTNSHVWDPNAGTFLSREHQRIAEIIADYDPYLSLAWIPPRARGPEDKEPYAVVHSLPGQEPYVICHLREDQINEGLLAWLWSNDNARDGHDPLQMQENKEIAERALAMKKEMERREELMDVGKHIIGGKNYYKHNGVKYQ